MNEQKYKLENLGKNIKYFLQKDGSNQIDFANKCGVSQRTISKLVKCDGANVRLDTLVEIANGINVSIDELLSADLENQTLSTEEILLSSDINESESLYFRGKKLFLYFDGGMDGVLHGSMQFDKSLDVKSHTLRGKMNLAHKYECILSIRHTQMQGGCFYVYGIDKKNNYQQIAFSLFIPGFHDNATEYTGGVGILTHVDDSSSIVSQRILVSDQKLDVNNEDIKRQLIYFLTFKENTTDEKKEIVKIRRIGIDRTCDKEYVQWLRSYKKV